MNIWSFINNVVWYGVATVSLGVITLMLLRFLVGVADLNPFGWMALNVRRATDPLVNPVRRSLVRMGLEPKLAPLLVVLITLVLSYIAYTLIGTILFIVDRSLLSLREGSIVRLCGYLLSGLLALYSLLIFIRIVFTWGLSPRHPVMHFLLVATEPVLAPFRRIIPPLGMFDISPIVVLIVIRLFQEAIAGTLLAR